jgi:tetratricopeptide (TPR) repeat protein
LSEAGKLREAAEELRHSMHGVPNAGAGRAPPVLRQTEAAERFRRRGVGLVRAGKLAAAITALLQATRLDPADAGSHRALGLALLRSGRLAEAIASFELAIVLEEEGIMNPGSANCANCCRRTSYCDGNNHKIA